VVYGRREGAKWGFFAPLYSLAGPQNRTYFDLSDSFRVRIFGKLASGIYAIRKPPGPTPRLIRPGVGNGAPTPRRARCSGMPGPLILENPRALPPAARINPCFLRGFGIGSGCERSVDPGGSDPRGDRPDDEWR
jgi:hypothetical protein